MPAIVTTKVIEKGYILGSQLPTLVQILPYILSGGPIYLIT